MRDEITNSPPAANETKILWMLLNLFFRYLLRISAQFFFFIEIYKNVHPLPNCFYSDPTSKIKLKYATNKQKKAVVIPFVINVACIARLKNSRTEILREKCVTCLTGLNVCSLQQTHSKFSWANWRKLNLSSQDEWKWEWNANSQTTYSGFSVCLIVIYLIELPHSIIFSSIDRAMRV